MAGLNYIKDHCYVFQKDRVISTSGLILQSYMKAEKLSSSDVFLAEERLQDFLIMRFFLVLLQMPH